MVPALTILRAQFPTDLYQVGYDDLVHALEFAHLGKHETDFTLRTDLSRMRLKRGKGGRYNVSQLVHDFEAKLLMCKFLGWVGILHGGGASTTVYRSRLGPRRGTAHEKELA